jgi:predicted dehydrogenase
LSVDPAGTFVGTRPSFEVSNFVANSLVRVSLLELVVPMLAWLGAAFGVLTGVVMSHRIAIAGLGASAREIHLPAYKSLPQLEIVGGCDPLARPEHFSFPLFASVPEMLEKTKPDILAVVTPPDSHFDLASQGLQAGCHIVCEKPFMNSLEEADAIIELAGQAGRQVVVNNQYRFMRIQRAAKEKIGSPEFGNLLFVSMHQTFLVTEATEEGWRGRDPQRTGKEFGTHALDLCRYFFDENPTSISARMPRAGRPDGPDYLDLIQLEFSRDRVAHITLDRLSRGRHRYLDIRLDGDAGSIETSLGGRLEGRAGIRGVTRRPFFSVDIAMGGRARLFHGEQFSVLAKEPLNVFAAATGELMRAFLAALERGEIPECNAADNRHTLALMLGAYESDAKRTPIAVG